METTSLVFIREIPENKITDEILKQYEGKGFKIVYTNDSVEIWG